MGGLGGEAGGGDSPVPHEPLLATHVGGGGLGGGGEGGGGLGGGGEGGRGLGEGDGGGGGLQQAEEPTARKSAGMEWSSVWAARSARIPTACAALPYLPTGRRGHGVVAKRDLCGLPRIIDRDRKHIIRGAALHLHREVHRPLQHGHHTQHGPMRLWRFGLCAALHSSMSRDLSCHQTHLVGIPRSPVARRSRVGAADHWYRSHSPLSDGCAMEGDAPTLQVRISGPSFYQAGCLFDPSGPVLTDVGAACVAGRHTSDAKRSIGGVDREDAGYPGRVGTNCGGPVGELDSASQASAAAQKGGG